MVMMDERNDGLRGKLDALKKKAEVAYGKQAGRGGVPEDHSFEGIDPAGGQASRDGGSAVKGIPGPFSIFESPSIGDDIFKVVEGSDPGGSTHGSDGLGAAIRFASTGRAVSCYPDVGGTGQLSGSLEDLVPGSPYELGGASFYRALSGAETVWDNAPQINEEYLQALLSDFPSGVKGMEPLKILQEVAPEDICYLDIETTGLRNAPLFLVGLMYSSKDKLMQDLLFARDYTEEKTVLRFLSGFLGRFKVLVTFNGLSFDMPFIAERMAVEGVDFDASPPMHIDLLRVSRKVLKKKIPNHKLQTLEVFVLGRKRVGDIPGSDIPGAYHEYVRTGDAGLMAKVIYHNRLDLLSMLELVTVFLAGSR